MLEAKKLGGDQAIGVTDEQGRLAHLFSGKTGRFATKDQKKLVAAKLLLDGISADEAPSPVANERKKRTSRAAKPAEENGAVAAPPKRTSRRKRTSIMPASAGEVPPAAAKRTSRRPRKSKEPEPQQVTRSSIWNP